MDSQQKHAIRLFKSCLGYPSTVHIICDLEFLEHLSTKVCQEIKTLFGAKHLKVYTTRCVVGAANEAMRISKFKVIECEHEHSLEPNLKMCFLKTIQSEKVDLHYCFGTLNETIYKSMSKHVALPSVTIKDGHVFPLHGGKEQVDLLLAAKHAKEGIEDEATKKKKKRMKADARKVRRKNKLAEAAKELQGLDSSDSDGLSKIEKKRQKRKRAKLAARERKRLAQSQSQS